eukprot:CAMPEP_0168561260 /NCGR_PEP_ID=MMETSP0413-20121227/11501_1 /TAXON_ID=136452 /ORGANISM="Filamoeba nolandi, Strain NC-AS-23-1" /LENGTH=94 /DNA_ID=CAMNT_0008592621 /DNA_START=33 /DNA_END=317 /DNA_ORIENTATION=-
MDTQRFTYNQKDFVFWVTKEETKPSYASLLDWCPCTPKEIRDGPCREAFAASMYCYQQNSKKPIEETAQICSQQFKGWEACLLAHPEIQTKENK